MCGIAVPLSVALVAECGYVELREIQIPMGEVRVTRAVGLYPRSGTLWRRSTIHSTAVSEHLVAAGVADSVGSDKWVLVDARRGLFFARTVYTGPGRHAWPNVSNDDIGRFLSGVYLCDGRESLDKWSAFLFGRVGAPFAFYHDLEIEEYPRDWTNLDDFREWWLLKRRDFEAFIENMPP